MKCAAGVAYIIGGVEDYLSFVGVIEKYTPNGGGVDTGLRYSNMVFGIGPLHVIPYALPLFSFVFIAHSMQNVDGQCNNRRERYIGSSPAESLRLGVHLDIVDYDCGSARASSDALTHLGVNLSRLYEIFRGFRYSFLFG